MRSRAFLSAMLVGAAWLLLGPPARGQDAAFQRDINEAIDRGVAYLRGTQEKDGRWPYSKNEQIGATALAAWTLLECGVPADDPAVRKAANLLRKEFIHNTHTYSVALGIMFFDRLGDASDEPLIKTLALRLMTSQADDGSWAYMCVGRPVTGDNSNTQFAMLALWVARRHGMPVDANLALVERRFRAMQNQLGCWAYVGLAPLERELLVEKIGSTTAMTCAGVLALALTQPTGPNKKIARRDLAKDPQVRLGLAAVAALIGTPLADRRNVPKFLSGNGKIGKDQGCYCLWSLERMAVVYDLKTIGNKDWYVWGAQILLGNQQTDGSWLSYCGTEPDTCFALLFLKRANVARDLTDTLKGKVRDPGKSSPQLLQMVGKEDVVKSAGSAEKSREVPQGASEASSPKSAAPPTGDAAKLSSEISAAAPAEQDALLEKLRDTPGSAYTQALAGAIPKLRGSAKTKARQALAQRFERLDIDVLRVHLMAPEPEMRRAAAVAAGAKKAKELGPDLVRLLEDHEVTVLQAARAALRQISGQDFGPEVDASPAERTAAVEAWRRWSRQQKQ